MYNYTNNTWEKSICEKLFNLKPYKAKYIFLYLKKKKYNNAKFWIVQHAKGVWWN